MADKLKVGVIGTGIIGKSHVGGYMGMGDDVDIVAVADLNVDEAEHVALANNIPNVFADYRVFLKMDEIDGGDVCLPNNLHMPVTVDALKAGKNVYCEKPMARTSDEAQIMYDTAKETGDASGAVRSAFLVGSESRKAFHRDGRAW